jgi:hypothetical protein
VGSYLGEGREQSRTEPEDEGVEIRDILFSNVAESGFWRDLKDKYLASEIVVDGKNTDEVTRDDLRQLYCYLKPALGYWGFIICRSPQDPKLHAFNRTLFRNFCQARGVLILSDEDLRRMVAMVNHGQRASDYLRDRTAPPFAAASRMSRRLPSVPPCPSTPSAFRQSQTALQVTPHQYIRAAADSRVMARASSASTSRPEPPRWPMARQRGQLRRPPDQDVITTSASR